MSLIKLQPHQIDLPLFISDSGDLNFNNLITGFKWNLNRNLTGDFNISGNLLLNSGYFFSTDSTNSLSSDSLCLGGNNNTVNQGLAVIIAGSNNNISEDNLYSNVILNAYNSSIASGSRSNTILVGSQNLIGENSTGSVIISDNITPNINSSNNSLDIIFASGTTINSNKIYFKSGINVDGDVKIGTGNNSLLELKSTQGGYSRLTAADNLFITGQADFSNIDARSNFNHSGDLFVNPNGGLIELNNIFVSGNDYVTGNITCYKTIYADSIISSSNNEIIHIPTITNSVIIDESFTINNEIAESKRSVLSSGFYSANGITTVSGKITGILNVSYDGYLNNASGYQLEVTGLTINNLTVDSNLSVENGDLNTEKLFKGVSGSDLYTEANPYIAYGTYQSDSLSEPLQYERQRSYKTISKIKLYTGQLTNYSSAAGTSYVDIEIPDLQSHHTIIASISETGTILNQSQNWRVGMPRVNYGIGKITVFQEGVQNPKVSILHIAP